MECVLRVYGTDFEVDKYLAESPWRPNPVHKRGEKSRSHARRADRHEQSGFVLGIPGSDTPGEIFADQAATVLAFLRENHAEFLRLRSFPGIETKALDFGVPLYEDQSMRSNHIPVELVHLAATLSLALEVSVYACSAEPAAE